MVKESKEHVIKAEDCGRGGILKPEALMDIWMDTILDSSERLGVGASYMKGEGLGWVLIKNSLDTPRWPKAGERVTAHSWPAGKKMLFAYRQFVLEDAAGEEMITGDSCWMLLDLIARRPVTITQRLTEVYGFDRMDHKALKFGSLKAIEDAQYEARYLVSPENIDSNGHVNNAVYLTWALGTLPEVGANGTIRRIECAFKREALLGMDIAARAAADGGGRVTRHELKDSAGETLFQMRVERA